MELDTVNLGLSHFWTQADIVIRTTSYLLLAMSVLSWFLILWKTWSWLRIRSAARQLDAFWAAASLDVAVADLRTRDPEGLFVPLAQGAANASQTRATEGSLAAQVDRSELVTRVLRQRINEAAARLEAGLTFLASIGSTAPFVGLFGTVWGIYHAMMSIATTASVSIDKVAGPVGEALLMTAFGLAVAIPAVLAYNAFTRVNRVFLAQLDGFAHDLHAFVTTGARLEDVAPRPAAAA